MANDNVRLEGDDPVTPQPASQEQAGATAVSNVLAWARVTAPATDSPYAAADQVRLPNAPVAERIPVARTCHGDTVVDDYEWMAEDDDPKVAAHLAAEQAYTRAMTAHLQPLQDKLFAELTARSDQTGPADPFQDGNYWYYTRPAAEGQHYDVQYRCPVSEDSVPPRLASGETVPGEQLVLDQNAMAEQHPEYFALGFSRVIADGKVLAYSVDTTGAEKYTLRFRDIATGVDLDHEIPDTSIDVLFSDADTHVFYCTSDERGRHNAVWRHRIDGSEPDVRMLEEPDERFFVTLRASASGKYLMAWSGSKRTTEGWMLESANPEGEFRSILPRREGVEYMAWHVVVGGEDRLLIRHNGAVSGEEPGNFTLVEAPVNNPADQQVIVGPEDSQCPTWVTVSAHNIVLEYRQDALPRLAVWPVGADGYGERRELDLGPGLCFGTARSGWDDPVLNVTVESYLTPGQEFSYDPAIGALDPIGEATTAGGLDPEKYDQHLDWAVAADGTRVPLSIIKRKDMAGPAPLVLTGYGSYGLSLDPHFSDYLKVLLDNGANIAVAHVRGGGELGVEWADAGRHFNRLNTVTDFISCAEHLVAAGITSPTQMAAMGGSAGGMLVAAAANRRPDLFAGVLAQVPAVDTLGMLLNGQWRSTPYDREMWGNPEASKEVYDYVKSYSPYDNVGAQDYPPTMVTAGLNDPRVPYPGPAKFAAKLRASTTGENPVLLAVNAAGHSGGSALEGLRESALEIAWLLDVTGARPVSG